MKLLTQIPVSEGTPTERFKVIDPLFAGFCIYET